MNEVIAIFDIGKTNKKFYLLNKHLEVVFEQYKQFDEIRDEEGYPCEDLSAVTRWVLATFDAALANKNYTVKALNFSTYGASLVHLDADGTVLTPLYNYTKPYKESTKTQFFKHYGPENEFYRQTGAGYLGMLNSGLQIFALKHEQPAVFDKIAVSLHFPQYISYLFTGRLFTDYTSLGCHTALWDYTKEDYHVWVKNERVAPLMAPLVASDKSIPVTRQGVRFMTGVGVHDSSSALIPYLKRIKTPFILLSTGTWCVTMNPFATQQLTTEELNENMCNFLTINGNTVRTSRVFLGWFHNKFVKSIADYFETDEIAVNRIAFDFNTYSELKMDAAHVFFQDEKLPDPVSYADPDVSVFDSVEEAYHQLVLELSGFQVSSILQAIGDLRIEHIYVDGGFSNNEVFLNLLALEMKEFRIHASDMALGSTLGAALLTDTMKATREVPGAFKNIAI